MGSSAWHAETNIRLPYLLEVAREVRVEAESILYWHPHRSSHMSLLFKTIEVSSVKTCGLIASTPLMVYLFLSIRTAPKAWFVN